MRPYLGESNYPVEDTIAVADTAQILGTGNTFDLGVAFILITFASLACYIGKTSAVLASAADGGQDERIYIPASGSNILIPWEGQDVYFVNATATETPTLYVIGIV